jgi:hypothetical protein
MLYGQMAKDHGAEDAAVVSRDDLRTLDVRHVVP